MKRILVGILMMVLLIGTGFMPTMNVQAKEEAAAKVDVKSSYFDYLIKMSKDGSAAVNAGIQAYGDVSVYDSSKYLTSQYIKITMRENILCTDAYDMSTIAGKYQTVLAFGDSNGYYRPVIGYTSDGTAEIIYDVDGYDSLGNDKDGYDFYYHRDYEGYDRDGYDCQGHDRDGYGKDGYAWDGYDRDGYDRYGYDGDGYDRDGYNRNGYDHFGNKRNTFVVDKITVKRGINGKLNICVINVNGEQLDSKYYTYTTKAISVRKGCGTYKVTVKLHAEYGRNKKATDTLTKTFTVVPDKSVYVTIAYYGWERYGKKNGNTDCNVSLHYSSSTLKNCDGIQYVIGKDKNYKSVYASATTVLGKNDFGKAFKAKFNATCYIKYRVYTTVGGKKLYSEWGYDNEKLIP